MHSIEIKSPLFDSCGEAALNIGCGVAFWQMGVFQCEGLDYKTLCQVVTRQRDIALIDPRGPHVSSECDDF